MNKRQRKKNEKRKPKEFFIKPLKPFTPFIYIKHKTTGERKFPCTLPGRCPICEALGEVRQRVFNP